MEKMWAGRAQEQLDQTADDFNSSIAVDQRMAEQDITGSIAHAKMLAAGNSGCRRGGEDHSGTGRNSE